MREQWKDVIGYEGIYKVSNHGRVKALPRTTKKYNYRRKGLLTYNYKEKILSPCRMREYLGLRLMKNGNYKTQLVHRLVAIAFIHNPENKPIVNHIDFNPENNNVDNLEWCTQYENIHHTINHNRNRAPKGSENGHAKLLEKQIKSIRDDYNNGVFQKNIADKYKVNQSTISNIITKKTWNHA